MTGRFFTTCALLVLPLLTQAEKLNLVVQPIHDPSRAEQVYRPLVDYLNRTTEHEITLKPARTFHHFWSGMRKADDYDLVFDDAHFTDYRIKRLNYVPLVKSADEMSFALLAGYGLDEETLRGVVGRRLVTMPAPSLAFAVVNRWFPEPLQQPVVVSTARSWPDTVELVFAQEADAAMVPTWLSERYPNLAPIQASESFPGPAISASPKVSAQAQADIRDALLKLHEDESVYEALVEMNLSRFEPASAADFDGYHTWLSGFYGY